MRAVALLLAGSAVAGCQSAKAPPPPIPAYADLGVLVRRHPGWASVAQYDAMLARLRGAARQARTGTSVPKAALSLPAQSGLDLPGEAYTMPADALAQEQRQFATQTQAQLSRLRARRELAREQHLDLQQPRWQREAVLQYAKAAEAARARYQMRYDAAFAAGDVRRLNLTLQIHALEKTVADWKLSAPPPTPRLAQANKDLTEKRAELARLESERLRTSNGFLAERDASLAQAAAARDLSVQTQRARLAAELNSLDEVALKAQKRQLERQAALLLQQQRVLAGGTVRAAGPVGTVNLPSEPVLAAKPAHDLEAAARQLQGQRDRWIAFLYNDTQAAAQDAARQRGWKVTFGPPHRGETNVTAQLATLMTKSVWKA